MYKLAMKGTGRLGLESFGQHLQADPNNTMERQSNCLPLAVIDARCEGDSKTLENQSISGET